MKPKPKSCIKKIFRFSEGLFGNYSSSTLEHVNGSVIVESTTLQSFVCINNTLKMFEHEKELSSFWLTPNQKEYCF